VLKQLVFGAALIAIVAYAPLSRAQTPSAAAPTADAPKRNDYADPKSWLCRPGGHDACDIDETATIVAADGRLTKETWKADANAPIDCFYVYPTISTDPGQNSDMTADPAELNVVKQQFARFASKCRPYAPLYRQITLAGLRKMLAPGATLNFGEGVQYDDVRDAWNYYLKNDNNGRGVVLVAHSQGSFILIDLIKREIDGKPIQSKLVSAILMGTVVPVPKGTDVGGAFQHIPLCHSGSQTGCLITFASFRSTVPPPANTLFGRVPEATMAAACVNPAALAGGSGELHAYLSNDGRTITGTTKPKPWIVPEQPIETPWVSVPGLLTAKCTSNDNASGYLEVTVNGNPSDPRVDDIVGDIGIGTNVLANWGLHLVDVNLAMGNLLDIVGAEAKAYAAKKH
jgi:Protein of unknown function (DUF3089)